MYQVVELTFLKLGRRKEMGHQITQIARTENGGKYKVSISIPFELGWIERVKLNITTREQKNVYPMKHVKNENDMAYFETTIE